MALDAAAVTQAVRREGYPYLHFALGLIPRGDPNAKEPHVIGFVNRCAVPWYRVEPFSRLQPSDGTRPEIIPQMVVGPAYINPNHDEVSTAIIEAFHATGLDARWPSIEKWYEDHRRIRCRQWDFGFGDLV